MIINDIKELCFTNYIGKSRALCLDYGDKRIGIAISDINWEIASPLITLPSHGIFPKLFETIYQYQVGVIIIGAPKSLSGGNSGKQFEKVKKFTEKLNEMITEKSLDISILYWDERLSTSAANKILDEAETSKYCKKKYIDKIAASFILQGVLNYMNLYSK